MRTKAILQITAAASLAVDGQASMHSCETNEDCESIMKMGGLSVCEDGGCTNPFEMGCLSSIAKDRDDYEQYGDIIKTRVCNSDDRTDASCRNISESFAYDEVRIAASDWESTVVNSWIYQIILSEILNVPTTIEYGFDSEDGAGSFYDRKNRFLIGKEAYPFEYLKESTRLIEKENLVCDSKAENPCAHMIAELWDGALSQIKSAKDEGYAIKEEAVGFVGEIGYYIPRFTVEKDASLISFFGLKGESNREKLANTFNTPISWGDYCSRFSQSNCTVADNVAQRPPSYEEESTYFSENLYGGHFRQLDKNNCTINPKTCHGHFVIPSCNWTTYSASQMYWLNISLESSGPLEPNFGYTHSQMTQIWKAANSTKSDVILWWWTPEILKETFAGTPGEFQRIRFPHPTEECVSYRQKNLGKEERCSEDPERRIGKEVGSCDYQAFTVKKLISKGLETMTIREEDDLLRSPALEVLQDMQISAFALDTIFVNLRKSMHPKYAERETVCQWVYDNLDSLLTHIPHGHPRVIERRIPQGTRIAAIVVSLSALTCVFINAVLIIKWRASRILKLAKIDILIWVISGGTLVVIGALSTAIKVSDATCMISRWTAVLGYAIELVPIVIKVGTINKLVREVRQLQPRYVLNTQKLDLILIATMVIVTIYLAVSTALDPIKVIHVSTMDPETRLVKISATCSSRSFAWDIADYGLQVVILIIATVLVFQSRDVFEEFNEGQGLALMVYSHFVFLIMRIAMSRLSATSLDESFNPFLSSILKSLDIVIAISFYFGPKLMSVVFSNNGAAPVRHSLRNQGNQAEARSESESNNNMYRRGADGATANDSRMENSKLIGSLYIPTPIDMFNESMSGLSTKPAAMKDSSSSAISN